MQDTHLRRFVLSAETQIGKTGAYCWFLKLLTDVIHGDEVPDIPDSPGPPLRTRRWQISLNGACPIGELSVGQTHLLSRHSAAAGISGPESTIARSSCSDYAFSCLFFGLVIQAVSDRLIARLEGLADDGECVQSRFHIGKIAELKDEDEPQPPSGRCQGIASRSSSLAGMPSQGEVAHRVLKRIIDWDCVGTEQNSVYLAGKKLAIRWTCSKRPAFRKIVGRWSTRLLDG